MTIYADDPIEKRLARLEEAVLFPTRTMTRVPRTISLMICKNCDAVQGQAFGSPYCTVAGYTSHLFVETHLVVP